MKYKNIQKSDIDSIVNDIENLFEYACIKCLAHEKPNLINTKGQMSSGSRLNVEMHRICTIRQENSTIYIKGIEKQ